MRIDRREYRALPLRAHGFLEELEPLDVWEAKLIGPDSGIDLDLSDFDRLGVGGRLGELNAGVRFLFAFRRFLGEVFHLDRAAEASAESYAQRLTSEDRARTDPTAPHWMPETSVLYSFPDERLEEVINRTVHAFIVTTIQPGSEGHRLILAIYVRRKNWFTPIYMGLIAPFRHAVVYPAIIRLIERRWSEAG